MLVGLDATRQLPITGDFLELLGANTHTAPARRVDTLIRYNPQVYSGGAHSWDPLAAAVVVSPGLVATEEAAVEVVTTPGRDNGRTVRSDDGTAVTIARRAHAVHLRDDRPDLDRGRCEPDRGTEHRRDPYLD